MAGSQVSPHQQAQQQQQPLQLITSLPATSARADDYYSSNNDNNVAVDLDLMSRQYSLLNLANNNSSSSLANQNNNRHHHGHVLNHQLSLMNVGRRRHLNQHQHLNIQHNGRPILEKSISTPDNYGNHHHHHHHGDLGPPAPAHLRSSYNDNTNEQQFVSRQINNTNFQLSDDMWQQPVLQHQQVNQHPPYQIHGSSMNDCGRQLLSSMSQQLPPFLPSQQQQFPSDQNFDTTNHQMNNNNNQRNLHASRLPETSEANLANLNNLKQLAPSTRHQLTEFHSSRYRRRSSLELERQLALVTPSAHNIGDYHHFEQIHFARGTPVYELHPPPAPPPSISVFNEYQQQLTRGSNDDVDGGGSSSSFNHQDNQDYRDFSMQNYLRSSQVYDRQNPYYNVMENVNVIEQGTGDRAKLMGSDSELNKRGLSAGHNRLYYVHVPPANKMRHHHHHHHHQQQQHRHHQRNFQQQQVPNAQQQQQLIEYHHQPDSEPLREQTNHRCRQQSEEEDLDWNINGRISAPVYGTRRLAGKQAVYRDRSMVNSELEHYNSEILNSKQQQQQFSSQQQMMHSYSDDESGDEAESDNWQQQQQQQQQQQHSASSATYYDTSREASSTNQGGGGGYNNQKLKERVTPSRKLSPSNNNRLFGEGNSSSRESATAMDGEGIELAPAERAGEKVPGGGGDRRGGAKSHHGRHAHYRDEPEKSISISERDTSSSLAVGANNVTTTTTTTSSSQPPRSKRLAHKVDNNQQQSSNDQSVGGGSSQSLKSQTGGTGGGGGLSKKSNSTNQLSLSGTKKRLGFRRKQVTMFSVHRSEEVAPQMVVGNRQLDKQIGSASSEGEGSLSNTDSFSNSRLDNLNFFEGLGAGQIISRQALASPYLGDIQISLSAQRGFLEVEIIKARKLQSKPGSKSLPSPYVKVYLMKDKMCMAKVKTAPAKKTLDPIYKKQLIFREDYRQCILQIIVWGDYGRMNHKALMGIVQIQLDDLQLSTVVIGWYKLFNPSSMTSLQSKSLRHSMLSNSTQSFT